MEQRGECERCGTPRTERDERLGLCPVCMLGGVFSFCYGGGDRDGGGEEDIGAVGDDGTVGRYRLLSKLGEGAFGEVFLGEQTEPVRRRVAVKVLKAEHRSQFAQTRFDLERQALAQLSHGNICRLIEAGQLEDGRPYFAMDAIEGEPITEYCENRSMPLRARLELFVRVCSAVRHAHQKGVIHRDIKPGNIIVMERDGVAEPVLVDFGVARGLDRTFSQDTLLAEAKQIIGTPAYMSPEQADDPEAACDVRSDVFALGALLFELLVGDTPVPQSKLREIGTIETLQLVAAAEYPKPSRAVRRRAASGGGAIGARELEGDIDTIVAKALRREPERRFQSVAELESDVVAFLERRPIKARRVSLLYRATRFSQRRPAVASLLAFIVVLVAVYGWQQYRRSSEEAEAVVARVLGASPGNYGVVRDRGVGREAVRKRVRRALAAGGLGAEAEINALVALTASGDVERAPVIVERVLTGAAFPPELLGVFADVPAVVFPAGLVRRMEERLDRACSEGVTPGDLVLASMLAEIAPGSEFWARSGRDLVPALLNQPSEHLPGLVRPLVAVRDALSDALKARYRSPQNHRSAVATATVMAVLYRDDYPVLVDLIAAGEGAQLDVLMPVVSGSVGDAFPVLSEFVDRPIPAGYSDEEKDKFARGQARVAMVMLSLAGHGAIWSKAGRPGEMADPRLRSELVRAPSVAGVEVRRMLEIVREVEAPGEVAAVLTALGFFDPGVFSVVQRREIVAFANSVFAGGRDPESHAVARWLLSRLGEPVPELEADRGWSAVPRSELTLVRDPLAGDLVCIPPGGRYTAGPGERERGARDLEVKVDVRLEHAFCIAASPVTVGLVREIAPGLLKDAHGGWPAEATVSDLSLDAARAFCNALSGRSGLPESEWAYETEAPHRPKEGLVERSGFRIPTEAEWEFACRAGSTAPRPYGNNPDYLTDYYWIYPGGYQQPKPAPLLPNAFGLMEVLGGYYEWVEGDLDDLPGAPKRKKMTAKDFKILLNDGTKLGEDRGVLRSCARNHSLSSFRCSKRTASMLLSYMPGDDRTFRLARTLVEAADNK